MRTVFLTDQEINITGNSVDFSNAVIALDADGDEGGIIKVSSGSGLTIGGTSTIHANGGIFGAPGGVVTLTAGGDLNLSIDSVSANGGLLGGGGTIELKAGESGSGKMDLGNSKLLANGGLGATDGVIDIKMNTPDGDLRVIVAEQNEDFLQMPGWPLPHRLYSDTIKCWTILHDSPKEIDALYQSVLKSRAEQIRSESPEGATIMNRYAGYLRRQGRIDEAAKLDRKVIEIRDRQPKPVYLPANWKQLADDTSLP